MNESVLEFQISSVDAGKRIDSFLAASTELSRTRVADLIGKGLVTVNGNEVSKNLKLEPGDEIFLNLPEDREIEAKPENIPINVVYEDPDLIVVDKVQGMVVHPAPGNPDHTLVNALLYHCGATLSGIGGALRPGIVHRIDQYTSGLLVAAKSDRAHLALTEMFQKHDFIRKYHAVLYGSLPQDSGTVKSGIGRSKTDRKKMASYPIGTPNTKEAVTHFRVLERFRGYTYAEFTLETGRTHQIRVHAASIGHPVLDDKVYAPGRKSLGLDGQCLHAKVLAFRHPVTGEELYFESPLPSYFESILTKLRNESR